MESMFNKPQYVQRGGVFHMNMQFNWQFCANTVLDVEPHTSRKCGPFPLGPKQTIYKVVFVLAGSIHSITETNITYHIHISHMSCNIILIINTRCCAGRLIAFTYDVCTANRASRRPSDRTNANFVI